MDRMYQDLITARRALSQAERHIPTMLRGAPLGAGSRPQLMVAGFVYAASEYVGRALETIRPAEADAIADCEATPYARAMDHEDPEWLEAVSVRCLAEDQVRQRDGCPKHP